jgi:hypothetical protein
LLFVSGHGENGQARKRLTEFDKRFLEKPCAFELLSGEIREALEEPTPARAAA